MNAFDGTFTDAELKRNLRRFVGIDDGSDNLDLDKQDLQLKIGRIIRIYPCNDMVWVIFRDNNQIWKCQVLHEQISHDINVSYTPNGDYLKDNNGALYIVPSETYNCVVYPLNGEYNRYGAVMLGYITLNDSNFVNNAGNGSFKIQVGSDDYNMRFKIRDDLVEIKDNQNSYLYLSENNIRFGNDDNYILIDEEGIQNNCKSLILNGETFSQDNDYSELEKLIENKIDRSEVYTRTEVDAKLKDIETSSEDYYTKTEVDNMLLNKIDKSSGNIVATFTDDGVLEINFNDDLYI